MSSLKYFRCFPSATHKIAMKSISGGDRRCNKENPENALKRKFTFGNESDDLLRK